MQVAVRREQLGAQRKTKLGATVLDDDELDAEQRRQRSDRGGMGVPRVYLPACDETYLATAAICASVSTPLNAGMIAPPCSTCVLTRASGGFSWSRFGPTVPVVPADARVWHPPHFALTIASPPVPVTAACWLKPCDPAFAA